MRKYWESGSLALAVYECDLNPFEINKIMENDKVFHNSIEDALAYAVDLVEGFIYKKGIQGFDELEKDANRKILKEKRQFDVRCLSEYLKNIEIMEVPKRPSSELGNFASESIPINTFK